jgi:signal transduction histidine kinase
MNQKADMNNVAAPHSRFELLHCLFRDTATVIGQDYLRAVVRGLGQLLNAETVFIARVLDHPPTQVRVLAAWKDGEHRDTWEYALNGNPCMLTYDGVPTFIPCDVAKLFPNKKNCGYESYIGVPLKDADGGIIGHIAIYASKVWADDDFSVELVRLCGLRAEAEVRRLIRDEAQLGELKQLRHTQGEQTDLLSLASHELRAPLSSVISTLGAIHSGVFGELPKVIDDYIAKSLVASELLLTMTGDILEEARITADESLLAHDTLLIAEIVEDAVQILQPFAEQSNIRIEIKPLAPDLTIHGDQILLERLIGNLVSNAIKFSPEQGVVTIMTEQASNKVRISVTDQGPGIAEEYHSKIFERFAQTPTGRKHKGSGLGLSIAKKIALAHGGNLSVESTLGSGSRFIIELPA